MSKINKGDWIVITTKSNPKVTNLDTSREDGHMKSLDGMVLQLPEYDGAYHSMIKDKPNYTWKSTQGHFRLAEPHEIPGSEPNYEIY